MKNIRVINPRGKTEEYIERKPRIYYGTKKLQMVTYKGRVCVVKRTKSNKPYIVPYTLYKHK